MKNWNIEEMTGYKPITTFYYDFSIAERFGTDAIQETYARVFDEWKSNYKYLTELVMVLNWKTWEHYKRNETFAKIYNDLWEQTDAYASKKLKNDELDYFLKITD